MEFEKVKQNIKEIENKIAELEGQVPEQQIEIMKEQLSLVKFRSQQVEKVIKDTEALKQKKDLLISFCGKEKYFKIVNSTIDLLKENNITPLVADDLLIHLSQIYQLEQKIL